ncbi:MAG: hypothetical protein ACYC0V_21420 [Armatimonadota bacterium]
MGRIRHIGPMGRIRCGDEGTTPRSDVIPGADPESRKVACFTQPTVPWGIRDI